MDAMLSYRTSESRRGTLRGRPMVRFGRKTRERPPANHHSDSVTGLDPLVVCESKRRKLVKRQAGTVLIAGGPDVMRNARLPFSGGGEKVLIWSLLYMDLPSETAASSFHSYF